MLKKNINRIILFMIVAGILRLFYGFVPAFAKQVPCSGRTLQASDKKQASDTIDIGALSEELHLAEEDYDYPDFKDLFGLIRSMKWKEAADCLLTWFLETVSYEIRVSGVLYREIICIAVFSAIFSVLASAFPNPAAGESSFMVSWIILFMALFSNFRIMTELFRSTILHLSGLMKILIPVYTAAVTASGSLTAGIAFYEYYMILVLFLNWILIHIFLPGIQYYFVLQLFQQITRKQYLSKLCHVLYEALYRGIRLLFFLFFGAHLLESMLAPSFDLTRTGLLSHLAGVIPGAGSAMQTVAGTVIASGLMIKNTLGVSVILFLLAVLAVPLSKMLLYVLFNVILTILLEPVSDHRFTESIHAAGKCGFLMMYGLTMAVALLVLVIALTTMVTNRMI